MSEARRADRIEWDAARRSLSLRGDWVLADYAVIGQQIASLRRGLPDTPSGLPADVRVDMSALGALDTAGALRLCDLLGQDRLAALVETDAGLPPERKALLRTVLHAHATPEPPAPKRGSLVLELFGRIGAAVENVGRNIKGLLGFMGQVLEALARSLMRPGRWRINETVSQIESVALDAVPIVALLTFMVGAVVAFLGATVLADFGATIYTVHLVAFSFLREFAVLLTAILIAGRTASAYTAQLGSMKANEEIDAIRMLGLDPVDMLVLPRVLALLVSLPLLTFIGMVCGIAGGMLVCAVSLDISPSLFLVMVQRDVAVLHFVLGMAKAPVFAFLIALIGCLEGFKVSGSAQSVGAHTTSSVVQCIFAVILVDAIAAMFFMEMGW